MGSKIQAFQRTFNKGIAKPNLFHVMMNPPAGVQWNDAEMELRIQSVSMPGKNITTTPNDNAYGPSYEMANGISFAEDIEVTYILDADHRAREFFNGWQDKIVNPSTYDLNYYDDYVGTMTIYQLDQNDNSAAAIKLHEVYPKTVGPLQYGMDQGSSTLTVTVNMAFKNWTPLVVNFNGTHVASWIDDSNFNQSGIGGYRSQALSELYRIQSLFGIGLPPNVTNALNRVQAFSSIASNPLNFLKRTISSRIGRSLSFRL